MPQHTTVTVPANTWTQLTDANVTSITFQNISSFSVLISGTATAVAPANNLGALHYSPGNGERNASMADLFPGVPSAARVWAFSQSGAQVSVSHA